MNLWNKRDGLRYTENNKVVSRSLQNTNVVSRIVFFSSIQLLEHENKQFKSFWSRAKITMLQVAKKSFI